MSGFSLARFKSFGWSACLSSCAMIKLNSLACRLGFFMTSYQVKQGATLLNNNQNNWLKVKSLRWALSPSQVVIVVQFDSESAATVIISLIGALFLYGLN